MADRNDATPRVYTLELSGDEVKALVDYHLAQQEEADSSEAGCIGDAQRARQLQATLDSPETLGKAKAARVDWRAAVEEIRQGLAANHLSTSDDAGYRNYAEVVLDRLTDILAAQEKT